MCEQCYSHRRLVFGGLVSDKTFDCSICQAAFTQLANTIMVGREYTATNASVERRHVVFAVPRVLIV